MTDDTTVLQFLKANYQEAFTVEEIIGLLPDLTSALGLVELLQNLSQSGYVAAMVTDSGNTLWYITPYGVEHLGNT